MPNLIITTQCSNQCSFCFGLKSPMTCTPTDLLNLMSFLSSSGRNEINILGGEPTQHPAFLDILDLLFPHFPAIRIFTNGNVPLAELAYMQKIQAYDITFCVNRTHPFVSDRIDLLYRKLGHLVSIGFTYYEPRQPLDHIFAEIMKYRLSTVYRVGIALPGGQPSRNSYLALEKYVDAAEHLFGFIVQGLKLGITPDFDCGFPYCFFTAEQQAILLEFNVVFKSTCGVIPDILPNSTAIPCLPLAHLSVPISQNQNWESIIACLTVKMKESLRKPLYASCPSCQASENGLCAGGCAAMCQTLNG